jgi:hypothetical protein
VVVQIVILIEMEIIIITILLDQVDLVINDHEVVAQYVYHVLIIIHMEVIINELGQIILVLHM